MSFKTEEPTLIDLLREISVRKIQLPEFQRGWVWDDNRIKALLASVSLSYPIGAIMLLDAGNENIKFKTRPVEGLERDNTLPNSLILDGQQRLTSLYQAIVSKKPVKTKNDKKKEILRHYYIDMSMALKDEVDRVEAIISVDEEKRVIGAFGEVLLDLSKSEYEYAQCLLPFTCFYDSEEWFSWRNNYAKYYDYESTKLKFMNDFEQSIFQPFRSYRVPLIRLTEDTPREAVCKVFENVNTGGVSLTVFELVTATFAAEEFDLREDWEIKKQQFASCDVLKNVDETAFLTAITLYSSYLQYRANVNVKKVAVSCKKRDVLNLTLVDYKAAAEKIVEGFIKAAKLLNREKVFSRRDLPYQTQLIPLSVICTVLGDKFENQNVKHKLIRWYWCGVLGELYGGANETRFALDVTGVIDWLEGGEEPATIRDATFVPTRLLTLQTRNSAAYKGIMILLMKKGCKDFINGDPIELTSYFQENIDIHHIFPKSYCEKRQLARRQWNSIINKTPLSYRTNRILGGRAPSSYLGIIENKHNISKDVIDEHLCSHLIDVDSIRNDDFSAFIVKRASSILNLIESSMGKKVNGRNSEETIRAFGKSL